MIDLTPIFQAIIALLAALVTYKLVPWLKSKMTDSQYKQLRVAAEIAVYAAEQIYGAGNGNQKLEYAMRILERRGFTFDAEMLRAAIEDAVYKQVPKFKNLDSGFRAELMREPEPEEEPEELADPDWDETK